MNGKKKQPSSITLEEDYLRIQDVAAILNCSITTAYRMATEGAIPTLRMGSMLRVPKTKLMKCIAEHSQNGDTAA